MPTGLPTLYPSIRTYDNNMQNPAQDHAPAMEMSLREHLLAAGAGQPTAPPPPPIQQHTHTGSPQHAIDPAIAGTQYAMSQTDNGDGHSSEGRKGRRELSQSKRAAQNRAAQRAFRQRKEEYIKQLKDQVKEYQTLVEHYTALQKENYQLRDYIINLQSRLLENQSEIPPAPAGVDLTRQHPEPGPLMSHQAHPSQQQLPQPEPQQQSPSNNNGGLSESQIGELQMAAQAAAAAQHGPAVTNGEHHASLSSYDAGDYADKRPKEDDTAASGGPVGNIAGNAPSAL